MPGATIMTRPLARQPEILISVFTKLIASLSTGARENSAVTRALCWVTMLGGLTGCYKYTPLTTTRPVVGARIAVDLTSTGTDTLARFVGPNVVAIEGRVDEATDSALLLAVSLVRKRNGEEDFWKGETVSIPRTAVSGLRQRRLATGRTLLVAGAVAAISATVGVAASGGGGGGGGGGGPPPIE
jgi:hypothetical protein